METFIDFKKNLNCFEVIYILMVLIKYSPINLNDILEIMDENKTLKQKVIVITINMAPAR